MTIKPNKLKKLISYNPSKHPAFSDIICHSPSYISFRKCAKLIGVTDMTVRKWTKQGKVTHCVVNDIRVFVDEEWAINKNLPDFHYDLRITANEEFEHPITGEKTKIRHATKCQSEYEIAKCASFLKYDESLTVRKSEGLLGSFPRRKEYVHLKKCFVAVGTMYTNGDFDVYVYLKEYNKTKCYWFVTNEKKWEEMKKKFFENENEYLKIVRENPNVIYPKIVFL
jgi:hypothetical protein